MNRASLPLLLGVACWASPLFGQDYELVSQTESATLPNAGVGDTAMSGDGRYVVYASTASDIISGDTNGTYDVFLTDTLLGTTELISRTSAGAPGNEASRYPEVSEDGRYVVFASAATDLVPGDVNGKSDVFRYDRTTGTMTLVSVSTDEVQQNKEYWGERMCDLSDDGRYVAWVTLATNLSGYDIWGSDRDVYLRDLVEGTTELVSIAYLGTQRDTGWEPSVSADGSLVSFTSNSWLMHPDDSDSNDDVFVWHRATKLIEIASQTASGFGGTGGNSHRSRITPDGRYVVFESSATDLDLADTTTSQDIFLRDRTAGTTELVSYNADGSVYSGSYIASFPGCTDASVSADGRYVAWHSTRYMTSIEAAGAFLRDRTASDTELLGIPRWWWPLASGDGGAPQVTDDGTKVLLVDDKGSPDHQTLSQNIAIFRLRDTSKNQVHMRHTKAVWWGATFVIEADAAEPDTPWVLIRAFDRTGFSYGGASFDLSASYKIVDRGRTDAAGSVYWVSPVIPQAAAGLTLYLELGLFNADGTVDDSNHTQLLILG